TAGIILAKRSRSVTIIEKKTYPFHRVCGEYISNEVSNFLKKEALFLHDLHPTQISRFRLTTAGGWEVKLPLDLGGFGISRYAFDDFLYQKAQAVGVNFRLQEQVLETDFFKDKDYFQLVLKSGETIYADHVIGAF